MWHEDKEVKATARAVVHLIADHHGGNPDIYDIVKQKCPSTARLQYELVQKIKDEVRVLPIDGLELWLMITRLCKEHIIDLAQERLQIWLKIPHVRPTFKTNVRIN